MPESLSLSLLHPRLGDESDAFSRGRRPASGCNSRCPIPDRARCGFGPLAVGLCGTDAHIFKGEFPAPSPVVLGHEIAGIIDGVGAGVKGLKEGDMATVQPNTYCGVCRYCRTGPRALVL